MEKIRIGICGYGNLGKGVETVIPKAEDMELVAIFTRRDPNSLKTISNVPVINISNVAEWKDKIDVMLMCGGSATDLPKQVPEMAKMFNTIDTFDTHPKIPELYETVDKITKESNKISILSGGWDPGIFSILRACNKAILPNGNTYTFWGRGVSQGHSDAIRRVPGVKNAIQYSVPIEEAVTRVRNAENPELTTADKHLRECYVVAEEGADTKQIEEQIKNMPVYFADYKTIVHFISEEELKKNHSKLAHGGFVIHTAKTSEENSHVIEYSLKLDSNPEFTASVVVALARAAYRMHKAGETGAKTMLDISAALISPKTGIDLVREFV